MLTLLIKHTRKVGSLGTRLRATGVGDEIASFTKSGNEARDEIRGTSACSE